MTDEHWRDNPMTVGQLRALLTAFPDDALVYVRGYEGGLEDADPPAWIAVVRNHNEEDYFGPHEEVDGGIQGVKI